MKEDRSSASGDGTRQRHHRRVKARGVMVGLFVVVFSVLLPITYVITWAHCVILTNNGFERAVVPIGTDPAVTAAASSIVTDDIFTSLDPQRVVAGVLPRRAAFLAGPITNAAKGYVHDGVTKVLQSDQYQALWKKAVDFAHRQLLSVLNGNSKAVTTTNGQVVLNLVPLLNAALHNMQGFISGVVGHPIKLPTISGNEVPASACQKIATALSRPLPATCGQIPLFPADKLVQARHAVRIFNGVRVLLLILTPLVAAVALWLSRRRRRTLLQLSAGGLLGLVVIRRVVDWLSSTVITTGRPANESARRAVISHLFHDYFTLSWWLIFALVVVILVALIAGPYAWARSLRRAVSHYAVEGRNLVAVAAGHARSDATVTWVRSHLEWWRAGGVAVAVLLVITIRVSWIGLLIIAVLLAAYEWFIHRLGRPMSIDITSSATIPDSPPPGAQISTRGR